MGYSAGGHLALLYAYKSAAGHSVNGNPMHPISLVISEAGPIQFASKTVYNENEVEYGYVFADDNVCAMAGITMPNTTDLPEVYNEKLAILASVSPYCVAQDIEDKSILPKTILVYGHGLTSDFNSYIDNYGDGTVPIQPALDLYDLINNTSRSSSIEYGTSGCLCPSDNGNCVLYYFYKVHHNDFSLKNKVHPFTELENNELKDAILDYYDKINEKLNPSISN